MRRCPRLLAVAAWLLTAATRAQGPDHVVVVLIDDVGVDKVGAYGLHPTAGPTPVLDALAQQGVLFRRAYADPVCSPSRCAALTGRLGSRTGIGVGIPYNNPATSPNGDFVPSDDLPWLPRLLGAHGVRSFLCGKWHLTHVGVPEHHQHPVRVGFSRAAGHLSNLGVYPSAGYHAWLKNVATADGWSETPVTTYATVDSCAEALSALGAGAADGTRSLVWLSLNAAHKPWDLPPDGTYTPPGGPLTAPELQQVVLEATDTLLGRLRDAWAAADPDAAARTLWIVMGDNGTPPDAVEPPWPPFQHKDTVYEGGTHVPLIVAGAGVGAPGTQSDALVHIVDLWATVQDVLGVPPPRDVRTDSLSFAPALSDPAGFAGRPWVYVRHHEPNGFGPYRVREHAVRDARWKLIESKGGAPELYDLAADPLEEHNLWPPDTGTEQRVVDALQAVLDAQDAAGP